MTSYFDWVLIPHLQLAAKENQAFPDRKNEANRMVYVIKEHSCAKFVDFLHVWFGVTKSMVSLDRFLLRSGYLTSTDVLHVFWMESVADIVRIPVVLFLWHWLNEFRWN